MESAIVPMVHVGMDRTDRILFTNEGKYYSIHIIAGDIDGEADQWR